MQLIFGFGSASTRLAAGEDHARLLLPHNVLEGTGEECWSLPAMSFVGEKAGNVYWWKSDSACLAIVQRHVTQQEMPDSTGDIYTHLLQGLGPLHPYRFWNFIPGINQPAGELDNYKLFCMGRAEALAPWSAGHDNTRLPAASALGTPDDQLCVVMLGTKETMQPVENPQQIPAYRYPTRYGPSAPSFARASLVGATARHLYVSGTASIRQSESLHDGDPLAQLALACENIRFVVDAATGQTGTLNIRDVAESVRLYIRNASDWLVIRDLARELLEPIEGTFNAVQADICRPELLMEVEASLRLPGA